MVRCKAREILRNEAGLLSAAVTKDECNAAAGRFSTASPDKVFYDTNLSQRACARGKTVWKI